MELARARAVDAQDELYSLAQEKFMLAESIQKGCASYNLACLYSVRNDKQQCQEALEKARDNGNLPDEQDIVNDSDLGNVQGEEWFAAFIESLHTPQAREAEELEKAADDSAAEDEAAVEESEGKEEQAPNTAGKEQPAAKDG